MYPRNRKKFMCAVSLSVMTIVIKLPSILIIVVIFYS